MNNQLQYISQGNTVEEQVHNIHKALDNGCDWTNDSKKLFR
jgi:thiamine-phosphate pyrophosphorylase